MKILGGSFGASGSAFIREGRVLAVVGDLEAFYEPERIIDVTADSNKQRGFGCFGFVVGGLMLAGVLFLFLGLFGAVLGFALAAAGSFYTTSETSAVLRFDDGKHLRVSASKRELRQLYQFAAVAA